MGKVGQPDKYSGRVRAYHYWVNVFLGGCAARHDNILGHLGRPELLAPHVSNTMIKEKLQSACGTIPRFNLSIHNQV